MLSLAQVAGNLSVFLAAVLYTLPLQRLLHEFARKKEDGGGAIAGAMILLPMWLLLLVGEVAAIASGGLDATELSRNTLYAALAVSTVSLAAVSFASLMTQSRPTWTTRLLFGAPIYAGPPLTIAFVATALNPIASWYVPIRTIHAAWTILAAICVTICVGFLIWQLGKVVVRHAVGFTARLFSNRELTLQNLTLIDTLDPQRDFDELLRLANRFSARNVRELALTRLRSHPDFVSRLATALGGARFDNALALLEWAELSSAEIRELAPSVRDATTRYAHDAHESLRYAHKNRRKVARRWGRYLLRRVAKKFGIAEDDFAAMLATFDAAFDPTTNIHKNA
jgi:hypothetical protein